MPLYPSLSPTLERDSDRIIMKGTVIFQTDSGTGRFKEEIDHINFLDKYRKKGLYILLSLPNETSVSSELDQFLVSTKDGAGHGH